jgi:hypothetical protein
LKNQKTYAFEDEYQIPEVDTAQSFEAHKI